MVFAILYLSIFPWFSSIDSLPEQVKDTIIEPIKNQEEILSKVDQYTHKSNILSRILSGFLTFEKKEINSNNLSQEKFTFQPYEDFKDKLISKISIQVISPFGVNVLEPDSSAKKWVQKAGNFFHINTQKIIIKNILLFHENEKLNPLSISESERYIRQTEYIYDTKIYIKPIGLSQDSVEVLIVVQDLWTIGAEIGMNNNFEELTKALGLTPTNIPVSLNGNLGLIDNNFLGLGTKFRVNAKLNPSDPIYPNWDGELKINNIYKTFFQGRIYYITQPYVQNYGLVIERDFFSPLIHWAGGLTLNRVQDDRRVVQLMPSIRQNITFLQQDVWIGLGTNFKKDNKFNENQFIFSASAQNLFFTSKLPLDTFLITQNRLTIFGSLGYSFRRFFKDNYFFGLGRTEDIPVGTVIAFVPGYVFGEVKNRPYLGFKIGKAWYNFSKGYFSGSLQSGSFFQDNKVFNYLVSLDFIYITKLYRFHNWKIRSFAWLKFASGEDLTFNNRPLDINNFNGIRGFNSSLRGSKRIALNLETNIHLPFNLLGFRFAGVLFADFAWLGDSNFSNYNQLFQGYGIGLRIRNEHILFLPLWQIQFGWYPEVAPGVIPSSISEHNPEYYKFNNFGLSRPNQFNYQY